MSTFRPARDAVTSTDRRLRHGTGVHRCQRPGTETSACRAGSGSSVGSPGDHVAMSENEAATTPPLLYTMEEAAEILRVSREYLYRMRKNGQLVAVRFGRRVLVESTEIERVIAAARAA